MLSTTDIVCLTNPVFSRIVVTMEPQVSGGTVGKLKEHQEVCETFNKKKNNCYIVKNK